MFGQLIFWDNELKDRRKVNFDVGQKIKIARKYFRNVKLKIQCPEREISIECKQNIFFK